jgi:hypothetical protein
MGGTFRYILGHIRAIHIGVNQSKRISYSIMKYRFTYGILLLFMVFSQTVRVQIPNAERQYLIEIHNNTTGEKWNTIWDLRVQPNS